jgi:RimJ/RimL family protein N-acetyltransferase
VTQARLIFDDKERVGAWVAEQVGQTAPWGGYYAMGVEMNGEITAGFVFNNFNDSNATCHIAVSRGSKAFLELLDHGWNYAFNVCKLRRLTGMVDADNVKALHLDKKIGFVEEAVMKQAGTGGIDLILLVLWPENYFRSKHDG